MKSKTAFGMARNNYQSSTAILRCIPVSRLKSAHIGEICASACSTDRCGSPPPLRSRKSCQSAETSPAPSYGRPPNLDSSSQQCFRKRSPLAAAASSTRSNIPDLVWNHHSGLRNSTKLSRCFSNTSAFRSWLPEGWVAQR